MNDGISARFPWTLAEVTEASRWHHRMGFYRRRQLLLLIGAVLCAAWFAIDHWREGPRPGLPWGALGAGYFLLLLGLMPLLIRWQVRRAYAKNTARDTEIHWDITPTVMKVSYVHGASELKWTAFNKAAVTPTGLLLYPQPNLFHWLPRHGFASAADFDAVAGWAREHLPALKQLR